MMKICIVEDDTNFRKALEITFSDYPQYEIVSFKNAKEALDGIDESFDVIITDINMPKMDGLQFLSTLQEQVNGHYKAIVITGNASVQNAIKAIRLGVKDFLIKEKNIEKEMIEALERIAKEQERELSILDSKPNIQKTQANTSKHQDKKETNLVESKRFIASSPALEQAKKIALKVAPTDANVFLMGQSGVGKDVFANFIHENSNRSKSPFIAINMAAIPEHLLESELFGYEKGAFTDATAQKLGILEVANGGTVFLDEIGEMPIALQAKLLRVLQEKTITRLGSSKGIAIDVRFISATNANIAQKITRSEFRQDLFFRLQTIPIFIPPLSERKEEILQIAEYKLQETTQKYGFEPKTFSKDSKEQMLQYAWHGNVRELLSVIERAVILSDGSEIKPEDLALQSRERVFGNVQDSSIMDLEKELLSQTFVREGGNIKNMSDLLGMSESVLRAKIAKYGI